METMWQNKKFSQCFQKLSAAGTYSYGQGLNDHFILQKLEEELRKKDGEKSAITDELETLKKEQEDLLVLLTDQDAKISKYKSKLRELGQEVGTALTHSHI